MALLHWRKFAFFEEEVIKDTELNQLVEEPETSSTTQRDQQVVSVRLSCSCSGRGSLLLGDENGYIYMIDKNLRVNSFRANQRSTDHVKQVPKLSIFITCGSDQDGINPLIKLWDPEKKDKLNQPTCIKVIRANSGFITPTCVTYIECDDLLTSLAVGYEDGTLVIFYELLKRRRLKKSSPLRVGDKQITGIKFITPTDSNHLSRIDTAAFISTENEILFCSLSETHLIKLQLDQIGCKPRSFCLLSSKDGEDLFAVGRENAVYFYQADGRGPCLAFEGDKLRLFRFKTYLVIISRDSSNKASLSNPLRARRLPDGDNVPIEINQRKVNLNIYDIKNKYIAHSSTVPEVKEIISDWGLLFVICYNGRVILFREKDTQTKLETLYRKNQFSLVIDIARSLQYHEDDLAEIYKHYGDHLFRKGDYDGSIAQYIKTIGRLEPTFVIRKFLDSKRLTNLTVYLEALHQRSQASQEHTKILLNCYSKLCDVNQLKKFIESFEQGNIKFNIETAIRVLRAANFHDSAIYLAKKHGKNEFFFEIQIEDKKNIEVALDHMSEMTDSSEMALYMKNYGRLMLKDQPDKTIDMINSICQLNRYPEEFFHIFVDNNDLFVRLLEQLVEGSTDFATKAVHSLLLELYLDMWRGEKDHLLKNLHSDRINRLLSLPEEKLDINQALILCRSNRFDEGLIELYARTGLYHLVLQYHIDQDDSLKIMKTCEKFGVIEPGLYMPALMHYAKNGDERLSQILKAIEHQNIIAPMVVIEILLESKRATLGSVKDYLVRFLGKLKDKYMDNCDAIDQFKDYTESIRQKIDEFRNHQTLFHPSKCSACNGDLYLPSVHFLCNHCYHQSCFHNHSAESEECPICVTSNRKLLDVLG